MITYKAVEEEGYSDYLGQYRTYGIRAVDEFGSELVRVCDVATDGEFVEQLAKRCTEGQLAPFHLDSVVRDALD